MNTKLKRLLLPFLKAVKESRPISFRMRSAASQGLFLIGKPTSKKIKGRLRRVFEKTSAKALKHEETAKIREAVFKRAGGECERCSGPGEVQMHHLEGGSGRRREQQWIGNCMALCGFCHREYHRDPEQFRELVMEWCVRWQYPIPARFRRAA